jgi:hypothetical protein
MERRLRLEGQGAYDGLGAARVAFIQCVGSRDEHVGRGYCSQVGCRYAVRLARLLKARNPGLQVSVFKMDIQSGGRDFAASWGRRQRRGPPRGRRWRRRAALGRSARRGLYRARRHPRRLSGRGDVRPGGDVHRDAAAARTAVGNGATGEYVGGRVEGTCWSSPRAFFCGASGWRRG